MPLTAEACVSSKNERWGTPPWLFAQLDREFSFDLDASAESGNRHVETYIGPDHPDPGQRDALTCDWSSVSDSNGKRIDVGSAFQNPPYGRRVTGLFVRACYEQSRKGITVALVIFARTDTIWWHEYAMKAAELRLLRGRVKFIDPDTGEEGDAAGAPTVVLVFRPGHEGPPDVSAMVRENGQARLFGVKGG